MQIELDLDKLIGTFEIEDDVHVEFEKLRRALQNLFEELLNGIISNLAFIDTKEFTDSQSVVINHGFGTKDLDVVAKIEYDNGDEKIQMPGNVEFIDDDTILVEFSVELTGQIMVLGKLEDSKINIVSS
jgi:hypothetical protein